MAGLDDLLAPAERDRNRLIGDVGVTVVPHLDFMDTHAAVQAEVLWSGADKALRLPSSVNYPAMGKHVSIEKDGTNVIANFVAGGSSRLEVGHQYLVPYYWDDTCVRVGADWSSLDPVPFDGGIGGVGELEGQDRSREEALQKPQNATAAMQPLFALAGLGEDQVATRLARTAADPKPFVPSC